MTIYLVQKTIQQDYDSWEFWTENRPITYHTTKELAEAKLVALVKEEFDKIQEFKKKNPHLGNQRDWELLIMDNKGVFTQSKGIDVTLDLFTIKEIAVETVPIP